MKTKNILALINKTIIAVLLYSSISIPQIDKNLNASNIKLAIKKLNVLGSVLYIAAHPDDENTAFLSYASSGKLLETGYLSLTRGDGGQNLIGTEQSDLLGIIRTEELLQARKIDGTKQFFSRAVDFGYSKTAKETLKFWNKQKILYDVIWTIRKFRPDVIVTRFPGTGAGGHGNHTASAMLAKEAFKLAADPKVYPEQLKYVKPWQPKRIMWNAWIPLLKRMNEDPDKLVSVNLGGYNPLLGLSYTEIAALSRSMHKSQGFGSSGRRGASLNYFQNLDGSKPINSVFDGIDLSWNRVKGGKEIGELFEKAYKNFNDEKPYNVLPFLLNAINKMGNIKNDYWVEVKKEETKDIIKNITGLWMEANANDFSSVPGENVNIKVGVVNRSPVEIKLKKIIYPYNTNSVNKNDKLEKGYFKKFEKSITLPKDISYTQPYWLQNGHPFGSYDVIDKTQIGKPDNEPALKVTFVLSFSGTQLSYQVPVQYTWTDPVDGEKTRPFEIRPVVSITPEHNVLLFPSGKSREIKITLLSNKNNCNGNLKINLKSGWKSHPSSINFNLKNKYDEKVFTISVTPPENSSTIELNPIAVVNGKKYKRSIQTISYKHIPIRTVFPLAKTKLVRLNINKVLNNIGYIMGPGDLIPSSLEELGYKVKLLTDDEISKSDLNKYDVIISGIRAYNTRSVLTKNNKRLLQYVKSGGTFLMQYNNSFRLKTKKLGPYPFHISHKRVTEENAKIRILDPTHKLFNYPNKITKNDFKNWIQERGLYFADTWDKKYITPTSSHDNGETNLNGGLLYTKYGKGIFIYTGYSFFRQLPAGVPGAYRLFINLISAGKE